MKILKTKLSFENFNLVVLTSNKVNFHGLHESFKCTLKKKKRNKLLPQVLPFYKSGKHGFSITKYKKLTLFWSDLFYTIWFSLYTVYIAELVNKIKRIGQISKVIDEL